MSWNGYPSFTCDSILKRLKISPKKFGKGKDDEKIVWISLPYLVNGGDNMKNKYFKKAQKCF